MVFEDELEKYFQELEEQDKFSGVVLITQGNMQLFSAAYGFTSRSWKIRNIIETRFDTASITELFTAVTTMQLIDLEQLSFDTSVIEFLRLKETTILEMTFY